MIYNLFQLHLLRKFWQKSFMVKLLLPPKMFQLLLPKMFQLLLPKMFQLLLPKMFQAPLSLAQHMIRRMRKTERQQVGLLRKYIIKMLEKVKVTMSQIKWNSVSWKKSSLTCLTILLYSTLMYNFVYFHGIQWQFSTRLLKKK